jgi:hypothetical protein
MEFPRFVQYFIGFCRLPQLPPTTAFPPQLTTTLHQPSTATLNNNPKQPQA